MLGHVVDYFKVSYPIGYTTADKVDAYLGRDGKQILKIPQMVILDRHGIIRATSGSEGNPALENEASLHEPYQYLAHEEVCGSRRCATG